MRVPAEQVSDLLSIYRPGRYVTSSGETLLATHAVSVGYQRPVIEHAPSAPSILLDVRSEPDNLMVAQRYLQADGVRWSRLYRDDAFTPWVQDFSMYQPPVPTHLLLEFDTPLEQPCVMRAGQGVELLWMHVADGGYSRFDAVHSGVLVRQTIVYKEESMDRDWDAEASSWRNWYTVSKRDQQLKGSELLRALRTNE